MEMKKIKLTVNCYDSEMSISINEDCKVHEFLDVFIKQMEFITFQEETIKSAIIERSEQILEEINNK